MVNYFLKNGTHFSERNSKGGNHEKPIDISTANEHL